MDRKQEALRIAQELCAKHDSTLLYLTFFGSELYGTSTGNSDTDVRGIFLPSIQSLILGKSHKSLRYSSGEDTRKNDSSDIDIDLWSLDYWSLKLLPSGDTGALDLLFSPSNRACVILKDSILNPVFNNPLKFLDPANNSAYAAYSISQAKKYGIKGSRYGALKRVWKWLEQNGNGGKLEDHLAPILADCHDPQFCFAKDTPSGNALILCGKVHLASIPMPEFAKRIEREMAKYGGRALEAEKNQGLDFKALSHAIRGLEQMREVLLTGKIIYPLACRDLLTDIKKGMIPWLELEKMILERLAEVDSLQKAKGSNFHPDRHFAESFILGCYGYKKELDESDAISPIRAELKKIEKFYNVKILYAAESGSRAWGFPSMDSDYDIRFVYVHDLEWYLQPNRLKQRDVIEASFVLEGIGELDFAGWELAKALNLLHSGNPQLAEWLVSPTIYIEEGPFAGIIRSQLENVLSKGRMRIHYAGLLKKVMAGIKKGDYSRKKILYGIRALGAILWIDAGRGVPPIEIDELATQVFPDEKIRRLISELVLRKKTGHEHDLANEEEELLQWLENEYAKIGQEKEESDFSREKPDINAIFKTVLYDAEARRQKCLD